MNQSFSRNPLTGVYSNLNAFADQWPLIILSNTTFRIRNALVQFKHARNKSKTTYLYLIETLSLIEFIFIVIYSSVMVHL